MSFKVDYIKSPVTGFTLVELVIVIIVMGILAAVALPKLTSKSAFEDYTVKDQLISRLRLVQLQNMNAAPNDGKCYWVVTKSACFYNEATNRNGSGTCISPTADADVICGSDTYNQYNVVNFSDGILANGQYHFDSQGRLTTSNSPISLGGENNLSVQIESEGYIHE